MSETRQTRTKKSAFGEALRMEVQKDGPILLWVGEKFPECRFRGINLDKVDLPKWAGIVRQSRVKARGEKAVRNG